MLVAILHTQNFIKMHQFVVKILNGNKIMTSLKGHNFVEKLGKILCISNNMDLIYQCIYKILSKSCHYF